MINNLNNWKFKLNNVKIKFKISNNTRTKLMKKL